ncbi:MAG: transketolase [Patescibacteria group bacterium]
MPKIDTAHLENIARLVRYFILLSTTTAGSGHPSSSLSAVELMTTLYFNNILKFDLEDPKNPNNDRVIFSKGHASPLFYALYAAAGKLSLEELKQLRKFDSPLEGHPTKRFPYTEVATGSLGQGLSAGVGMAINAKYLNKLDYKTYVLLGDSEMAEGSNWEAMQVAAHYKLNNLVAILDVNKFGQRGETMQGHNIKDYAYKARAFGWRTAIIDGHDFEQIQKSLTQTKTNKPVMIIAKTLKGKGVNLLENKKGWHGKVLDQKQLKIALEELGKIDLEVRGGITSPASLASPLVSSQVSDSSSSPLNGEEKTSKKLSPQSTRDAYGQALAKLGETNPEVIALDAEVSNSTFSSIFKDAHPDRFFEMFIAEQNMMGVAIGLAERGKTPYISTFAAFLTRSFDQVRMAAYSQSNLKIVGSHAGVSIGEDGPTQMGLEDIAMIRSIHNSVVLYPSDARACEKLVFAMAEHRGLAYLRTTRAKTKMIYKSDEKFQIGGSKTLKQSSSDQLTIIAAGITLHEALKAYKKLEKEDIKVRIIDLYSIKPVDGETIRKAASETGKIITVEDHYSEGGIAEAVLHTLGGNPVPVHSLAVRKMPRSGKKEELLAYMEIDSAAIIKKVKEILC